MFGHGYFGSGWFGPSYWGPSGAGPPAFNFDSAVHIMPANSLAFLMPDSPSSIPMKAPSFVILMPNEP